MIKGLYHIIAQKLETAKWQRQKAKATSTDPRLAHEAEVQAKILVDEARELEAMARADEAVLPTMELLIHDLATSTQKSRYRSLALTDLESAANWLRRELGDKPNV